jgi:hypothetical protein
MNKNENFSLLPMPPKRRTGSSAHVRFNAKTITQNSVLWKKRPSQAD